MQVGQLSKSIDKLNDNLSYVIDEMNYLNVVSQVPLIYHYRYQSAEC